MSFSKFQELTRAIFQLIKTYNHAWKVQQSSGSNPGTNYFQRVQRDLQRTILPAAPTDRTMTLLAGNCQNWTYNTLLILEDHYANTAKSLIKIIGSLPKDDCTRAWETALQWARRRYPHLNPGVIQLATQELQKLGMAQSLPIKPPNPEHLKRKRGKRGNPNGSPGSSLHQNPVPLMHNPNRATNPENDQSLELPPKPNTATNPEPPTSQQSTQSTKPRKSDNPPNRATSNPNHQTEHVTPNNSDPQTKQGTPNNTDPPKPEPTTGLQLVQDTDHLVSNPSMDMAQKLVRSLGPPSNPNQTNNKNHPTNQQTTNAATMPDIQPHQATPNRQTDNPSPTPCSPLLQTPTPPILGSTAASSPGATPATTPPSNPEPTNNLALPTNQQSTHMESPEKNMDQQHQTTPSPNPPTNQTTPDEPGSDTTSPLKEPTRSKSFPLLSNNSGIKRKRTIHHLFQTRLALPLRKKPAHTNTLSDPVPSQTSQNENKPKTTSTTRRPKPNLDPATTSPRKHQVPQSTTEIIDLTTSDGPPPTVDLNRSQHLIGNSISLTPRNRKITLGVGNVRMTPIAHVTPTPSHQVTTGPETQNSPNGTPLTPRARVRPRLTPTSEDTRTTAPDPTSTDTDEFTQWLQSLTMDLQMENTNPLSATTGPKTSPQAHNNTQLQSPPIQISNDPPGPSSPHMEDLQRFAFDPPETPLFTRHEHGGNKSRNWHLKPERVILILGDSNVAKLPSISDNNYQVDCYPGAKLSHAIELLRTKTPTSPEVQAVLLSFGINNRERSNPTLTRKEINRLLGMAQATFPYAKVYIPMINYSKQLPQTMIQNIKTLNTTIINSNQHIPRLQRSLFNTTMDNIHWTASTGRAMWNHWRSFLLQDLPQPQPPG